MVLRSRREYHDSRAPFVEGAGVPSAILRRGSPHSLYPLEPAESGTISAKGGNSVRHEIAQFLTALGSCQDGRATTETREISDPASGPSSGAADASAGAEAHRAPAWRRRRGKGASEIESHYVVSNADPRTTLRLLGDEADPAWRSRVEEIPQVGCTVKLNVALRELPELLGTAGDADAPPPRPDQHADDQGTSGDPHHRAARAANCRNGSGPSSTSRRRTTGAWRPRACTR